MNCGAVLKRAAPDTYTRGHVSTDSKMALCIDDRAVVNHCMAYKSS